MQGSRGALTPRTYYTVYNKLTINEILFEILSGRLTHLASIGLRTKFVSHNKGFFLDFEQGVVKTWEKGRVRKVEPFDEQGKYLNLKEYNEEPVVSKYPEW